MSAISDALAIEHFDCSNGSTVERDFLEAVAQGLGFDGSRRSFRNKDLLLAEILGKATGIHPDEVDLDGGTVTNDHLRAVLDGIRANGLANVSLTDGAAAVRVATALFEETDDPTVFDYLVLSDERKRALREIVVRGEQAAFRKKLLEAYEGRCAVSGCEVQEVLEAAHINPYKGRGSSVVGNGLLLRADLHKLWDRGLIAVDESTWAILLAPNMSGTTYEQEISGKALRLPDDRMKWPDEAALRLQRVWARL